MKLRIKAAIVLNPKESTRLLKLAHNGHQGSAERDSNERVKDEALLDEYSNKVLALNGLLTSAKTV